MSRRSVNSDAERAAGEANRHSRRRQFVMNTL
jgi:hypothetical protein